ncbi:MAG: hypothetical protein Q4B82_04385 [Alysiella sp.]|uniref:hypothetical protein n=1 Tax=Alysiella sp. TaxID=1872483 RepID=UPI0026DCC348|nr:hypothetical protein [Alysiella sp.]MDO4433800.1 hypothetical protein [Alysiella sp.]
MTRHTFCFTLLFLSSYTLACTYLPATAAFIIINDRNNDRVLDWEEWQVANISDNLALNFPLGDEATFKYMDKNQDQRIEAPEMGFGQVHYLQNPCERQHNHHRSGFMPVKHRMFFTPHPN